MRQPPDTSHPRAVRVAPRSRARFEAAIREFDPLLPLAVAYSGGADSTALLLASIKKWPGQVTAIHIHHGLQAAADGFVTHCTSVCAQLDVPLSVCRVDGRSAPGQSPEDAARRARYHAFSAVFGDGRSGEGRSIAIAQHADDQVETILLALSRGAGLAGLAAMPAQWERDGVQYYRPLLKVSSADIRVWLAAQSVPFIEDPSNADERFTRNRIRARVVPALQAVFPHFRDTFSRSAAHAAQAQAVLDDVGMQDLAAIRNTAISANAEKRSNTANTAPADLTALADLVAPSPPAISLLQKLSRPRQANVLRYWLKADYGRVPSAAQLNELLHQVAACTTRGHQVNIKVADGFVRRRGDALAWYNP